ncbi:hypothetical protein [Microcystis phage MaeS]|nr:hypothetical protein [Microcystis phage MaeS]
MARYNINSVPSVMELVQSILLKYNEIIENTIFEVTLISGSQNIKELRNKGYDITVSRNGTETKVRLDLNENHVITYTVYVTREGNKLFVRRKRLINNLEEEC